MSFVIGRRSESEGRLFYVFQKALEVLGVEDVRIQS
jgi:hypothetical protein